MRQKIYFTPILLVLSLFFFLHICYGYSSSSIFIRVCVTKDKDALDLSVQGPYRIESVNKDMVLDRGRYLKGEHIQPTISGIELGEKEFKIYGVRIIPEKGSAIIIDGSSFRGMVDIIRTKDLKLMVINHLEIEEYLYGVLYHETPHYWPIETLKAQAVVARTFALYRIKTMKDRDYDVTSDIYSQMYGGKESERRRTTKAVNSTKGKVLTYKGEIFPTYYHSMCAGHTADAKDIFEVDLRPLRGVKCPFCQGAPHMTWKAMFSYKQMEERLNKYGIAIRGMNYIHEGERDKSGRLSSVKLSGQSGAKEIKGYKFRLALGPNIIKSTNFTIQITPKGIIFRGKGWGHGVGMCQWGAFGMGKRWSDYKSILGFYYPGSEITDIKELYR